MSILIIAEHNNIKLASNTASCVTAAKQLSKSITILIAGNNCHTVAEQASQLPVSNILLADNECYQYQFAQNISELVVTLSESYSHIIAPASTFGKDLMPRIAALLDVGMLSDVIKIIDSHTVERPIYAGNAIATVKSHDATVLMTIRQTAFLPAEHSTTTASIKKLDTTITANGIRFYQLELAQSTRPELTNARVVVSGGRGLQQKKHFQLIEQLADKLGAAIGASRAAVDADFVANDYQVGQTGKVVAPELYIAIGISGAIQHVAGIKESKIIVAINTDPDAPIFQMADYGLVDDLFTAVPALIAALD